MVLIHPLGPLENFSDWRKLRVIMTRSWILLLAAGSIAQLPAASVYVYGQIYSPIEPIDAVATGTFYCVQGNNSSASCSVRALGMGILSNSEAEGDAMASGSFGSLSGSAGARYLHDLDAITAYFTSFNYNVVVTGASGPGTLITHYQLTAQPSGSLQFADPGNPSAFSFVQGSTRVNVSSPGYVSSWSESFDVSSNFTFGVPLSFGAETDGAARVLTPVGCGIGAGCGASQSTVNLTGFTVLDSFGNVISDAQITRQFQDVNFFAPPFFIPEPQTTTLAFVGLSACLLVSYAANWHRKHCHTSPKAGHNG